MQIKNVVFDIGNVLVRWVPHDVVSAFFPQEKSPQDLTLRLFKSPLWYDLNLGKLTEKEALKLYSQQLAIPESKLYELMVAIKESLTPIEGSFELLEELYAKRIPLYSITDNVNEIVAFLRNRYNFFDKFSGIVISSEVGVLKPSPLIYKHLINSHHIVAEESVFIDDVLRNVEGAQDVGFHGIHFTDAAQCREELKKLSILTT